MYNSSDYRTRIETSAYFGEVEVLGEQRKLVFPFKEPNEHMPVPIDQFAQEIEDWVNNCSCSNTAVVGNSFEVIFTNKGVDAKEAAKYEGRAPYEVTVTLYFKDGKPLKVLNSKGVLGYNQEKAKVFLYIYGTIINRG